MKGRHDLSRNCHTYNDELLLVRKHNVCTTLNLARKLFNLIKTEVKIENWISKLKSPKEWEREKENERKMKISDAADVTVCKKSQSALKSLKMCNFVKTTLIIHTLVQLSICIFGKQRLMSIDGSKWTLRPVNYEICRISKNHFLKWRSGKYLHLNCLAQITLKKNSNWYLDQQGCFTISPSPHFLEHCTKL